MISNVPQMKTTDEDVEFVLIGAGLPRTGTASTCAALEKLLPGNCHHMIRAFTDKEGVDFWPKVAKGEALPEDWASFIKASRISAAVDFPMSLYWKDLLEMYPNAKVLLTVRDPVKWYLSVKNTIHHMAKFMTESTAAAPFRLIGRLKGNPMGKALFTCDAPTYLGAKYPRGMFGAIDDGQETAVRFFNDWKEQVIREVPADRLLVFEVKEGYAPLCKFLGVPVPDEPYPNVNDTKEQQARHGHMKKVCLLIWSVATAAVGTAAYFLYQSVPIPKISVEW